MRIIAGFDYGAVARIAAAELPPVNSTSRSDSPKYDFSTYSMNMLDRYVNDKRISSQEKMDILLFYADRSRSDPGLRRSLAQRSASWLEIIAEQKCHCNKVIWDGVSSDNALASDDDWTLRAAEYARRLAEKERARLNVN